MRTVENLIGLAKRADPAAGNLFLAALTHLIGDGGHGVGMGFGQFVELREDSPGLPAAQTVYLVLQVLAVSFPTVRAAERLGFPQQDQLFQLEQQFEVFVHSSSAPWRQASQRVGVNRGARYRSEDRENSCPSKSTDTIFEATAMPLGRAYP